MARRRDARQIHVDGERGARRRQRHQQPGEDQQIGEPRSLDDDHRHHTDERQRGDAKPRHARHATPQHAVPGACAGDQHERQHDQTAREHADRVADGEDDRGGADDQRDDRRELLASHRISSRERHRRPLRPVPNAVQHRASAATGGHRPDGMKSRRATPLEISCHQVDDAPAEPRLRGTDGPRSSAGERSDHHDGRHSRPPRALATVGTTDLSDGGHNGEPAVGRRAPGQRPGSQAEGGRPSHRRGAGGEGQGGEGRVAARRARRVGAGRRSADPVELLEEQAASRVRELVPIRYGRMLVSPFTFFRGAAYPMAADLADAPRTGLDVQLCGDAHLSNFGAFGAPDRRLVFSINDYDETLPGPFEWDVKRLVASFAVAGRDRGFDAKQRRSINRTVTRAYREAIREFAGMSNLDLWYSRIDVDEIAAMAAQQASGSRSSGSSATSRRRGRRTACGRSRSSRERRRRAADRERSAADRADRGGRGRRRGVRPRGVRARGHPLLPADPDPRPPAAARALSLRARGAQGRRRRQRRRARLDRADARPRRERSAVPAAQGGAGVGARAVPRQEPVQPPRPARRRGPATDAGGRRHHARLDPGHGPARA